MGMTIPAFVGIPGGPELLIILAIAVLLFGANKLPSLARSSGQAMGEFKKGRQEIEEEIRSAASDQEGIDPETGAEEASEPA
jgi:sec-independent protein translocase protein TatA|nr:twin-arginine translocase TatA/TatE family subunit [Salinirussus salinus]